MRRAQEMAMINQKTQVHLPACREPYGNEQKEQNLTLHEALFEIQEYVNLIERVLDASPSSGSPSLYPEKNYDRLAKSNSDLREGFYPAFYLVDDYIEFVKVYPNLMSQFLPTCYSIEDYNKLYNQLVAERFPELARGLRLEHSPDLNNWVRLNAINMRPSKRLFRLSLARLEKLAKLSPKFAAILGTFPELAQKEYRLSQDEHRLPKKQRRLSRKQSRLEKELADKQYAGGKDESPDSIDLLLLTAELILVKDDLAKVSLNLMLAATKREEAAEALRKRLADVTRRQQARREVVSGARPFVPMASEKVKVKDIKVLSHTSQSAPVIFAPGKLKQRREDDGAPKRRTRIQVTAHMPRSSLTALGKTNTTQMKRGVNKGQLERKKATIDVSTRKTSAAVNGERQRFAESQCSIH